MDSLRGVDRSAGIVLRLHPPVQFHAELGQALGLCFVTGQVVHLVGIIRHAIKLLGRPVHEALNQPVAARRVPGVPHPRAPVRVVERAVAADAHQVFLDVNLVRQKVVDVMVLAIVDGADRVGRPLRDVVVYTVDELPVSLFFAEQRVPKTGAVVGICARFSTGEFDERGQDVSVLHERIGAFVGRDTPGPTGD